MASPSKRIYRLRSKRIEPKIIKDAPKYCKMLKLSPNIQIDKIMATRGSIIPKIAVLVIPIFGIPR